MPSSSEAQLHLALTNATVTDNRAGRGGGLYVVASGPTGTATIDLRNTIL